MGSTKQSVAIIIASTRNLRAGPRVVDFVKEVLDKKADTTGIDLSILDLADFKLPVFDEDLIPGQVKDSSVYTHDHTKAWSAAIKKHDSYVFVSPEYNYGVPGGVKNAIDYLKHEWDGKPVAIVTYGLFGGSYSSENLNHVLGKMGLRVASTRPQLGFAGGVGQDFFAATKGDLGTDSKSKWEAEEADNIVRAFDELKVLLKTENQPVGA